MRIGGLSGFGKIASQYNISSIHGNPKSLEPISRIDKNTSGSKPLAIVTKADEEEIQNARKNQTMTASKDFESVMSSMMQGKDISSIVKPVEADSAEKSDNAMSSNENMVKNIDAIINSTNENINQMTTSDDMTNNASSYRMQHALDAYNMMSL